MSEAGRLLVSTRKLRERGEKVLIMAENFRDPEDQRRMHEIAERYQKLAQRLEPNTRNSRLEFFAPWKSAVPVAERRSVAPFRAGC
jgi:hypothetical protein